MNDPNFPTIDEWIKYEIIRRMTYFSNDKQRVSDTLGITVKTLHNKIRQHNLEGEYVTYAWSPGAKERLKDRNLRKKLERHEKLEEEIKKQKIIKELRGY